MQNQPPPTVLPNKENEPLLKLPENLSRTIKHQLGLLMEPFSSTDVLNAKIKRVFFIPKNEG
ncbi:hypothetical protein [Membranihabitans marinus]|uniref:hypothetical protein n=1 Tax=Membranihabitans marinus TaxID=1227546 RepID=UPI001F48F12D|nr:hypothetical protein [Membranihabitans marinus]